MKHLGDITKINGAEIEPVDVITGGSPCQDLSVAGKRAGLAGERSGLFMEQMRIVKEMRERDRANGRTGWMVRPRYMVWENVPGAFSSGNPKGADFAAVIEEIVKVAEPGASVSVCVPNGGWTKSGCYYAEDGSWSVAWRVHDAQFWGVPQRRKRIALVCDFGGLSAPEILFERKGLSGDSEQSGEAGEETAGAAGDGVEGASGTISFQERGGKPGGGKGILIQHEHIGALSTLNNQSVLAYGIDQQGGKGGANYTEDVCPPILSDSHGTPHAVAYGIGCDVYNQEVTGDVAASLTAASGGTNTSGPKVLCLNDQGGSVMGVSEDVTGALRAEEHGHQPSVVTYDARDNGDGKTVCTITGDHQNRVTDYTALCVGNGVLPFDTTQITSPQNGCNPHYGDPCHPLAAGAHPPAVAIGNGQLNQMSMAEQANTLDTMHDQQAVMVSAVDCRNLNEHQEVSGTLQSKQNGGYSLNYQNPIMVQGAYKNAETRSKTLLLLQETYGEETILKWGTAILERLQQADILQQGVYESRISGEAEKWNELDDCALPRTELVTGWMLRDLWKQQKCGRSPQGWKSAEQQSGQFAESLPKLSQQNSQACKDLFDMWQKGEGLWLLREALSEIQKIWKSLNGQRQSVYGHSIVRRLTPLEAERLQGYPDGWTDIGEWTDSKGKKHKEADSPRYKALGNSIALPFWQWMARRICAQYERTVTMASLFDGIGGFPLVFSRCGATPVWASEIEEFPMAVTRVHFPEEEK